MDYGTKVALSNARGGLFTILLGIWLVGKPKKTEEEILAAKSFLKTLISSIIATVLLIIAISIGLLIFVIPLLGKGTATRSGTVEDGQIRYVQGTIQYVSLATMEIDRSQVTDGDKVSLYFDKDDKLIGVQLPGEMEKGFVKWGIVCVIVVFMFIVFIIVVKNTFAKEWIGWIKAFYESYG